MMNIFSIGNSIRSRIATVLTPRFSRLDSLSIVSRQSDLRTYSAESSCETFSVGQSSPLAFPFKAKSQLAFSHQSVLPILLLFLSLFMGVGNAWGASPTTSNSFSELTGNIGGDANISYSTGQGSATTATGIDNSRIKLYRSSGDNSGGILLLTANNGVKITKINVTFTGTVGYRNASDLNSASRSSYTSLTSGSNVNISNWSNVQISNIVAKNTKTQAFISAITVTYSSGSVSYTVVWTINPAAGGTLSTTSGTSTTVTPNDDYTYGSPAYSVTTGTATVSQSTNTFTATPSANCTIRINMVEKPKYTVTWNNNGSEYTTTQVAEGAKPVFPDNPSSCDETSDTFYGWATSTWDNTVDNLTGKTVYTSADGMSNVTAAGTIYNAVFAKQVVGSETKITGGDFNDDIVSGWTKSGTGTYSGHGVKFDTELDYIQTNNISSYGCTNVTVKFKAGHNGGSGSVLTFQSLDASSNVIDSKTFTPTQAYTSQTTVNTINLSGSKTIKFVRITMSSKTNNLGMEKCEVYYTPVTWSKYLTKCCTPLGQINGADKVSRFLLSSYHYVKGRFNRF